jgi:Ca2+:H+ antiporter
LATLALILPNFAEAASGPSYSILQLEGVGLMSLVLWCVFVFVQTVKHRDYFLDAPGDYDSGDALHSAPEVVTTLLSLVLLVVSLAAVILLAKTLSYPVDVAIGRAGLPKAFVGVVIALIDPVYRCFDPRHRASYSLRSCWSRPCRGWRPAVSEDEQSADSLIEEDWTK